MDSFPPQHPNQWQMAHGVRPTCGVYKRPAVDQPCFTDLPSDCIGEIVEYLRLAGLNAVERVNRLCYHCVGNYYRRHLNKTIHTNVNTLLDDKHYINKRILNDYLKELGESYDVSECEFLYFRWNVITSKDTMTADDYEEWVGWTKSRRGPGPSLAMYKLRRWARHTLIVRCASGYLCFNRRVIVSCDIIAEGNMHKTMVYCDPIIAHTDFRMFVKKLNLPQFL